MYGTLPTYALVPLDYRRALDAAAALLAPRGPALLRCDCAELAPEVGQRFPVVAGAGALWVEPVAGWRLALAELALALPPGELLVVVASQPLARALPERRGWGSDALGLRPGGLARLRAALRDAGLQPRAQFGFHGPAAVALSLLSRLAERAGRPALGDRLLAAARLAYVERPPFAALGTVAVLAAEKGVRP